MKTHNDTVCRPCTIAVSPRCLVQRCSHGKIHVSVGELSLRLAESTFLDVATTICQAAAEIADPQESSGLESLN